MTTDGRRALTAAATVLGLVLVGAGVGVLLSDALLIPGEPVDWRGADGAERDVALAWAARAVLALAVLWLVIGAISARTSLVRRPGAAAARASWLGATRPWRARESTLGLLPPDRALLLGVPVAVLIATRAVQSSMMSWTYIVLVLGAWCLFAVVVRVLIRRRRPWPFIAAAGGVMVLRCMLALIVLSIGGPGAYWYAFWTEPVLRTVYIAVAFALFMWFFIACGWGLIAQLGTRRALATVLAAIGVTLAVPSLAVALLGLDEALEGWIERLGPVPPGLHLLLEAPQPLAWAAFVAGAALSAVAAVLLLLERRGAPGPRTNAAASVRSLR